DAAKEAQGPLEMRISKLKDQIANARVIDASQLDISKVSILSSIKIKNLSNNMEMSYTLVPEIEADLSKGIIFVNTPIDKGILGKKLGEIADIQLPNGTQIQFEILDIKID